MSNGNLSEVFHSDPQVMGGTPVFTGTRVPVQNLVDYLEEGESIDEFLAGFPTVTRHQVIGFIEAATEKLLAPACSGLTWGQDNPESNAVAPVGRAAVAAER